MEYPPLVAGRPALFAIHLTRLADFTPVSAGQATVEFTPESGGAPKTLAGPKPSRPGAFRVEEAPPPPGRYRWALVLEAPDLSDRHELGTITVFADEQAARAEAQKAPPEDATAIAYLKEQQWTNEFAAAPVQEAEMRSSVRVPATVQPLPGGEAIVAAPAAGRFSAETLPRSAIAFERAGAWPAGAAALRRAPTGPRSKLSSPRRGQPWKPRRRSRRARNGCWRSGPFRPGVSRTRAARSRVAEAQLRAAEARLDAA